MTDLNNIGIFFSELTGEVYVAEQNKRGTIKQKRLVTETFDMISKAREDYLKDIKEKRSKKNGQ